MKRLNWRRGVAGGQKATVDVFEQVVVPARHTW
jgi:hypothetical protein